MKKCSPVLFMGLFLLVLLSFAKAIWVSLDIDESYAVAQSYRMCMGDRLVYDMWEPHQFSGLLDALLIGIYMAIHGSGEGVIIFLRIVGICLHLGIGIALYTSICRDHVQGGHGSHDSRDSRGTRGFALAFLAVHLLFLPKWVQLPEFELMLYWSFLLIYLCMKSYIRKRENGKQALVFAGFFLLNAALCYPTMVLLYPFFLIGICRMEREKKEALRACIRFTLGAAIPGLLLVGYIIAGQDINSLFDNLSCIFMDTSHMTYSMDVKWIRYLGMAYSDFLTVLPSLLAAAIGTLLLYLFSRKAAGKKTEKDFVHFLPILFLLQFLILQTQAVWQILFAEGNQFTLQIRFLILILAGISSGVEAAYGHGGDRGYSGCREYFAEKWFLLWPAMISFPLILLVTNMDLNATYAKLFPAVLASLLFLQRNMGEAENPEGGSYPIGNNQANLLKIGLLHLTITFLIFGFLICRLLLIRVTGCSSVTVRAPLVQMEKGAEKGIYVLALEGNVWNDNYAILSEYVKPEDKLLYFGAENQMYLTAGAQIASPSTQGTNVYNEMFIRYYEMHPDRAPTVVIVDRLYQDNPRGTYTYTWQNNILLEWIEDRFAGEDLFVTDHMVIFKMKENAEAVMENQ